MNLVASGEPDHSVGGRTTHNDNRRLTFCALSGESCTLAVVGIVAFLDESKAAGSHQIISVGGIVVDGANLLAVEHHWRLTKTTLGLPPDQAVKYSGKWADWEIRTKLIESIEHLPVSVVLALLEDFRPAEMRAKPQTRSELYVHKPAFDYVLQRLATNYGARAADGPHYVVFDHRDDFAKLAAFYAQGHFKDRKLPYSKLPAMASIGFASSLLAVDRGPLSEIADLTVSAVTAWAGARCRLHHGKPVQERAELDRMVPALVERCPTNASGKWRGHSVVTHGQSRSGKELLRDHIDEWLDDARTPF